MANSITLRDVADLAGVSMGTASQALNHRPNVADDTRARVLDAARSLGYPVKNDFVDTQVSQIGVIGLLTKHDQGFPPDVNIFYSYIQAGVEIECRKNHISLMLAAVEVDASNHPLMWPAMITGQQVDGLILAGTFIEDTVDLLKRYVDIPIVLVDGYAPKCPYDSVVIDNEPGAISAVEYLIKQGHTCIGLIGINSESSPGVLERQEGYLRALKAHGIQTPYIEESWLSTESGYVALKRLLKRAPEVTAIFAGNDSAAIGVIQAARDLGLEVPRDLSVVGFDDVDLAKQLTPALTTVRVHKKWMGGLGVRQLLARAENPDQPKTSIVVSTQLITRDSVRIHAT
ncbi:MAG: LacI family DNA-binding transcriptional regulator [Anaerolineae bacterium]|nr:LacI family DNA-binding transcriptional regulator [Anaerolineae bacterium]